MVSAIWFHHFYILNLIKYLTCLYAKSIKKCEKIEIILTYFVKSTIFSFS